MNKIKFAIIGCGRISHKHIKALVNSAHAATLVGVCDLNIEKALSCKLEYESFFKEFDKVSAYDNYEEMIEKEDVDVVAIATESGYHAKIATYCMNRGKHVIVEKPMALSIKDADDMIRCSSINKVKLGICHQNRFNSAVLKLKNAIDCNKFGKVTNGTARILWNRDMSYYEQALWRGTWALDGGTLMNQCIHNIDLLQWMLGGDVESVYAQCDKYLRGIEAEDFGAIIIRFRNKTIGIIEGSACVYPSNLEETLSIFGEKGTVVIGGIAVNEVLTWKFKGENEEMIKLLLNEKIDNVYGNGHMYLYEDFINCIFENRLPLIHGEEGKKALSIVLAAYKSQLTSSLVKFPLEEFSTAEMSGWKQM